MHVTCCSLPQAALTGHRALEQQRDLTWSVQLFQFHHDRCRHSFSWQVCGGMCHDPAVDFQFLRWCLGSDDKSQVCQWSHNKQEERRMQWNKSSLTKAMTRNLMKKTTCSKINTLHKAATDGPKAVVKTISLKLSRPMTGTVNSKSSLGHKKQYLLSPGGPYTSLSSLTHFTLAESWIWFNKEGDM